MATCRSNPVASAIQSIRRTSFGKNVLVLSGGTVAGQALALLASPVIARLYSPAEYGILGIYMSALALVSVAAMLRYEIAIPVSDTDREAANVVAVTIATAIVTGLLCAIVVVAASWALPSHGNQTSFRSYSWFLPIGMLATAVYQSLSLWSVRLRDYRALAATKLTQSFGMITAQIVLGLASVGPIGLLVGHVIGQSGGIGSLSRRMVRNGRESFSAVSLPGMRSAAYAHRRFPMYSMGAAFFDTAVSNMPVLVLASLLGATVAGWYTLVQRVLFVPVGLLSTSVAQVYLGELSELKRTRPEDMLSVFVRRVKQMLAVGAAFGIILVAVVFQLVPIVFGARWREAATCAIILLPVLLVSVAASPFGCTLDVLQRQDLHLARDVIRACLVGAALGAVAFLHLDWKSAIILLSVSGVLSYLLYLWMSWYAIRAHASRMCEAAAPSPSR
jgi:lipopolysaccharide exporter